MLGEGTGSAEAWGPSMLGAVWPGKPAERLAGARGSWEGWRGLLGGLAMGVQSPRNEVEVPHSSVFTLEHRPSCHPSGPRGKI